MEDELERFWIFAYSPFKLNAFDTAGSRNSI